MPRGDLWLRRSVCLPTRWEGSAILPNSHSIQLGTRILVSAARETRVPSKRAPGPTPPKANAIPRLLMTLTPRRTSLELAWDLPPSATLCALDGRSTRRHGHMALRTLSGEPLGNTREHFPPSGSPQFRQHAMQRAAGGVSTRKRNRTQRDATQQLEIRGTESETRST